MSDMNDVITTLNQNTLAIRELLELARAQTNALATTTAALEAQRIRLDVMQERLDLLQRKI